MKNLNNVSACLSQRQVAVLAAPAMQAKSEYLELHEFQDRLRDESLISIGEGESLHLKMVRDAVSKIATSKGSIDNCDEAVKDLFHCLKQGLCTVEQWKSTIEKHVKFYVACYVAAGMTEWSYDAANFSARKLYGTIKHGEVDSYEKSMLPQLKTWTKDPGEMWKYFKKNSDDLKSLIFG